MQPSFSTQVNKSSEQYFSAIFAPSIKETSIVSVQPFTAIFPFRASTPIIMRCFPIALTSSSRNSVFKTLLLSSGDFFQAEEPMITFSAPREISSFARLTEWIPPPVLTLPFLRRLFKSGVFIVSPFGFVWPIAASKSITATSPYLLNSFMRASASSLLRTSSFPFFNWTTWPSLRSIELITIMKVFYWILWNITTKKYGKGLSKKYGQPQLFLKPTKSFCGKI